MMDDDYFDDEDDLDGPSELSRLEMGVNIVKGIV